MLAQVSALYLLMNDSDICGKRQGAVCNVSVNINIKGNEIVHLVTVA